MNHVHQKVLKMAIGKVSNELSTVNQEIFVGTHAQIAGVGLKL